LQERIKKATDYFSGKIKEIVLSKLEKFSIETDNKEVRKKIEKAEKRLLEEALFKQVCLQSCSEGFVVKDYLQSKAKASMEDVPKKATGRSRKLPVSREISNPELYNLLKEWRNEKASEQEVSHYMILSLKTMRALSNQVPSNTEELKSVHGFGKRKLETFGNELLELINEYREGHDVKIADIPVLTEVGKKPKEDTRQISKELWLKYKDLKKIAEERDLVRTTIEGHLARFVGNGELPVTDFVEEEKLKTIIAFFKENDEMSLSESKEKLGDGISYGELKMVRQHLLWEENNRD
jgi:hypothetical protein